MSQPSTKPAAADRRATRRRQAWILVAVLLSSGLVVVLGLAHLGSWLVVSDTLSPAAAILVLSGEVPFRAMEAAQLYRDGWATEIWLTASVDPVRDLVMKQLELEVVTDAERNRRVLLRLGVPEHAIAVLEEGARNTEDELQVASRELARRETHRLIIVTSPVHTRRTRAIWRAVATTSQAAMLRPARHDPFSADNWWGNTTDIASVAHEILGMLNVWAGLEVEPR